MSTQLLPPGVIGVIGGGQLGMMTVREAQRMGYRTVVLDPDPECPASRLADETLTAPFADLSAAQQLVTKSDVITYEFENIDLEVLQWMEERRNVYPGSTILRIAQHRRMEKEELRRRGYPTVEFETVNSADQLLSAIESIGLPVLMKTVLSGYDGKGQSLLKEKSDVESFIRQNGETFSEYVVEKFFNLQCEISVVAVRGKNGEITTLPVAENIHRENILHTTFVPGRVDEAVRKAAEEVGRSIIEEFNIIGVLCVEMFVTADGKVLVNELAPRPHNSGHYSLDACDISQFEALVRTVCGLSLPAVRLQSPCAMVNVLGKHLGALDVEKLHRLQGVKLHLYGKKRSEPKRKMGHLTILHETTEGVERLLSQVYPLMGEVEHLPIAHQRSSKAYSIIA